MNTGCVVWKTYFRSSETSARIAFASGELRIPIEKLRLPYLADSDDAGTVQLVNATPIDAVCLFTRSPNALR